jgi:hypothetical protein
MERLRCGVILTDSFLSYLEQESLLQSEGLDQSSVYPVAIVDYVKCAEGPRAGTAYWKLSWGKGPSGLQDWCLFRTRNITIYMSRQTQRALKWKHIDYRDGQVFVPH